MGTTNAFICWVTGTNYSAATGLYYYKLSRHVDHAAPAAGSVQGQDSLLSTPDTLRRLGSVSGQSLPLIARLCPTLATVSLMCTLVVSPGFESPHGVNHPQSLCPLAASALSQLFRLNFWGSSLGNKRRSPICFCTYWHPHLGLTFPDKSRTLAVHTVLDFLAKRLLKHDPK